MNVVVKQRGNFKRFSKLLDQYVDGILPDLNVYGQMGVDALQNSTPVDSGLTAMSWDYKIEKVSNGVRLSWFNTNVQNGYNIALLIQYGHGTTSGGYVSGRDYINPALKPIFDDIERFAISEVQKL